MSWERADPPTREDRHGFRTNPRQIVGGVIAVALLAFILGNRQEVRIEFFFAEVRLPLWIVLAATTLLGAAVGFLLGGRRQKRRMRRA